MTRPKSLRVLVLCHESLVPPRDARGYSLHRPPEWRTEFDVLTALRGLGHEALVLGVAHEVEPLLAGCRALKPDVVFNLLVEFHGRPTYDQHIAALLELLELPYTGCNPRGLTLARDKALSKQVLAAHGIDVPRFQVFARGAKVRREAGLAFPLIVKSRTEEASLGLARASVVHRDAGLARRVALIHELGTDAIAEEYLDGRELYSGLLGAARPRVLPTWELVFGRLPAGHPRIATRAVKFSPPVQRRLGVKSRAARLAPELEHRVTRAARGAWETLGLSGYARIDLRLTPAGRLAVLEANPNPELARGEDFADAAEAGGLGYPKVVAEILELARRPS